MTYDPIITADDVIRAGACAEGVYKTLARLAGKVAAAMPASAVVAMLRGDEKEYAANAASFDGYGDGNGYGNGYGDGNGDGNGYGYGNGNGDGDGDGYGNGNGFGSKLNIKEYEIKTTTNGSEKPDVTTKNNDESKSSIELNQAGQVCSNN